MAAEVINEYGKIVFTEDLIGNIAGLAAVENYGIVGMNAKKGGEGFVELFRKENLRRGVKVTMIDNETVGIDLYVILEYGVSLPAVSENTKSNVRYRIGELLGLKVRYVNIHVEGIRH